MSSYRSTNELEDLVLTELNAYNTYLLRCVKDNKEFEYLEHIADKYEVKKDFVFNHNFDVFNYYMKNGVDEFQSKKMSLYVTHDYLVREWLKNEKG